MTNETSVGVIVARFQVAELTDGHKEILDYVLSKNHNQNVIFLGVAATKATKNNPLDYDSRRRMIEEAYPGKFIVLYIKDEPSDYTWSAHLDEQIADVAGSREVVLYGSRDSFGQYYHGKYNFEAYQQKVFCSGTAQRQFAGKVVKSSQDWRYGCLYATQNRFPTVYPTVDCAIFDFENGAPKYVYLAKKPNIEGYLFVGGFTDPTDDSFADAAKREAREETGLEVEVYSYIGSKKIDDWRYRNEEDKIITNFYAMKRIFGKALARDDISELHRVLWDDLREAHFAAPHRPLFKMLDFWMADDKQWS